MVLILTVASVCPYWYRISRLPIPLIPDLIETAIGPRTRGSYIRFEYEIWIKGDQIYFYTSMDPEVPEVDYDALDAFYGGAVTPYWHGYGLWWPSAQTVGWQISERFGGPLPPELEIMVRDWVQTIPDFQTMPERSTMLTWWLLADIASNAMFLTMVLSTWLVSRRVALRRRRMQWSCAECGYDLRGLPTGVCPECGLADRRPV